jgi:hypothetical protein
MIQNRKDEELPEKDDPRAALLSKLATLGGR